MKMQIIQEIAKKWDIPFRIGLSKKDLIRAIQQREGYTACFQREDFCEERACLWKDDCLPGKLATRV